MYKLPAKRTRVTSRETHKCKIIRPRVSKQGDKQRDKCKNTSETSGDKCNKKGDKQGHKWQTSVKAKSQAKNILAGQEDKWRQVLKAPSQVYPG